MLWPKRERTVTHPKHPRGHQQPLECDPDWLSDPEWQALPPTWLTGNTPNHHPESAGPQQPMLAGVAGRSQYRSNAQMAALDTLQSPIRPETHLERPVWFASVCQSCLNGMHGNKTGRA